VALAKAKPIRERLKQLSVGQLRFEMFRAVLNGVTNVDRATKAEMVKDLNEVFTSTNVVVVAHYSGLTVADMTTLRGQMAEAGASVRVIKNRLAKIALEGTQCSGISDLFAGPVAIAFSDDPVAAPRIAANFAKENEKLVILGGTMGETVLDVNGVKALAELPSLDELRGKLVGMISTPATRIAGVLQAPAGQVARVIGAYGSKDEAA
jgi:large subunit ribosomal protein L10